MAQARSGVAITLARFNASLSKDAPPPKEQNCFGTARPEASVVSDCKRLPSPPASTSAQLSPGDWTTGERCCDDCMGASLSPLKCGRQADSCATNAQP